MNKQTAKKLINKTRDDYNLIADQFASTRKFNWGDFAIALRSLHIGKGAKVLDLGCGNGRVYELLKDLGIKYYGLDISEELINHAKKSVPNGHFVVSDLLKTPYDGNEFDLVLSVATLHHIPSGIAREQALKEIHRILKPEGYVMITAWYFWNKPNYIQEILKSYVAILLGRSDLDFNDFFMIWKNGNGDKITRRYFHAWRKWELRHALKKAAFVDTKVSLYLKKNKKIGNNLIAIAQKPK